MEVHSAKFSMIHTNEQCTTNLVPCFTHTCVRVIPDLSSRLAAAAEGDSDSMVSAGRLLFIP